MQQPPGDCKDQRHGHVGGIFGQHAGRVGHGDAALGGGADVDIVDAIAVVGDQFKPFAGLAEDRSIDPVGDRGNEYVSLLDGNGKLGRRHRLVVGIEACVEQFAHPRFHDIRQLARHDNDWFDLPHGTRFRPNCCCYAVRYSRALNRRLPLTVNLASNGCETGFAPEYQMVRERQRLGSGLISMIAPYPPRHFSSKGPASGLRRHIQV